MNLPNDAGDGNNQASGTTIEKKLAAMHAAERLRPAIRLVENMMTANATAGAMFDPATWVDLDLSINAMLVNAARCVNVGNYAQAQSDLAACVLGLLAKINDVIAAAEKAVADGN